MEAGCSKGQDGGDMSSEPRKPPRAQAEPWLRRREAGAGDTGGVGLRTGPGTWLAADAQGSSLLFHALSHACHYSHTKAPFFNFPACLLPSLSKTFT